MKKLAIAGAGSVVLCFVMWLSLDSDWRRLLKDLPTDLDLLEWSVAERDASFRMLDRIPLIRQTRIIKASETPRILPVGAPLDLDVDLDAYMADNRSAGIVVLHKGALRLEEYGLGFTQGRRWTSFSVAKSFTSTLTGAALKDGAIKSLADPVSDYIPGLKGSAYDDVTIEQLLTMSSGVAWNEDYEDPQSDVARFNAHEAEDGLPNLVSYMKQLPRAHPAGSVWHYSTGETNLIGILVQQATGKRLATYLSEKIWKPYGMSQDATWLLSTDGDEISGCCVQATTRDFALMGQFLLEGAVIDGEPIVPDWWFEKATTKQMEYGVEGHGYGYQWWTMDSGAYMARGIFGQSIYIDPARELVIATNSNWRSASGRRDGENPARDAFHAKIVEAIDREAQN